MSNTITIVCVVDENDQRKVFYEIEFNVAGVVFRSGKVRGGIEPAVRNAESLIEAIINCGFSNVFDTALKLRTTTIKTDCESANN